MQFKLNVLSMLCILSISLNAEQHTHTHELPLVISVCAYNNAPWVEKNLNSIFMQHYDNFRVLYIDDASTDDTAALVHNYIDTHQLHHKMTLQVNDTRCRKTKNIYNAFHSCADHEIIVQVDGDDWLAHDNVFSCINEIYQHNDVWLTYGQFIDQAGSKKSQCRSVPHKIIKKRSFRSWHWVYTHLRTFKAWLFKSIKLEDFINEQIPGFEGTFFPLSDDKLSYYPMLEMCGDKFSFIPDVLYIYNRDNPLYSWRVESDLYTHSNKDIANRPCYAQVHQPIVDRLAQFKNAKADIIVLSNNNPATLSVILAALTEHMSGIANIYVVYEAKNTPPELQQALPHVHFHPIKTSITQELIELIKTTDQQHIVLADGTACPLDSIDAHQCIIDLERTLAYGFYFGLAHTTPPFHSSDMALSVSPHTHVYQDIYAWKFKCADPTLCNNLALTLLRKQTVLDRIQKMQDCTCLDTFMHTWHHAQHASIHNVGLFLQTQKLRSVSNIPKKRTHEAKQHK